MQPFDTISFKEWVENNGLTVSCLTLKRFKHDMTN